MNEQNQFQNELSKPFKTAESKHSELVVNPFESNTENLPVSNTVAEPASENNSKRSPERLAQIHSPAWKRSEAPHPHSISRMFLPPEKPVISSSKPLVKASMPMTRKRFWLFLLGLFLAAFAGNFANWFVSDELEHFFSPAYVQDFQLGEHRLSYDRFRGMEGMKNALYEGEKIEPNSRRYTLMTATFARYLDDAGEYLDAKTYWARAARQGFVGAPDLRELKRSFLISEAKSEHKAFAAMTEKNVDLDLLNQVEEAGDVFTRSLVGDHQSRAIAAYEVAASLAGDANDFSRAERDFHLENLAGASTGMKIFSPTSLYARWFVNFQRNLQTVLRSEQPTVLRSQYKAANWRTAYDACDAALRARKYDEVEKIIKDAQDLHLQDVYGYTVVTDLYSIDHDWGEEDEGSEYDKRLNEWIVNKRPSARARMATALAYLKVAQRKLYEPSPDYAINTNLFDSLETSNLNIEQAFKIDPRVAYEPVVIDAMQKNLYIFEKYTYWSLPTDRVLADLRTASMKMSGDDTRVLLNEFTVDSDDGTGQKQPVNVLVQNATEKANQIGGDEGDKFYTRAIWFIGTAKSSAVYDGERYAKGMSLLKKEFGYTLEEVP